MYGESNMETYITICKIEANGNLLYDLGELRGSVTIWKCGMGRETGGRFKRERTYVHLWLIHVDVWQKPTNTVKQLSFIKK